MNENKLWALALEIADQLRKKWPDDDGSYTRFWQCDLPAMLVDFARQADQICRND